MQLILFIRNELNKTKGKGRKKSKFSLFELSSYQLYLAIITIKRSQRFASRLYYLLYTCTWWMKWITGTTGQGVLISAACLMCRNQSTTNLWSTTRLKIRRRTQVSYTIKVVVFFYSPFTISSDLVHCEINGAHSSKLRPQSMDHKWNIKEQ